MLVLLDRLLADLAAESADLDARVADLPAADWALPTPAVGWTIAHQIAHLAWTDAWAVRAATAPADFTAMAEEARRRDGARFIDDGADEGARRSAPTLLAAWRTGRAELADALAAVPPDTPVPWFGPPMKPASLATARIMETWAHGQDVADALGQRRRPTARLHHIAHIGIRTRGFSFAAHGLPDPGVPVRVELSAPDGTVWTWDDASAADRVTGPAEDFCLLVTQRRHPSDLAIKATGPVAEQWLTVAQAFAGPPGTGREPTVAGER
jgi:uncharacterized protein (TIGR03084 family)